MKSTKLIKLVLKIRNNQSINNNSIILRVLKKIVLKLIKDKNKILFKELENNAKNFLNNDNYQNTSENEELLLSFFSDPEIVFILKAEY